MLNAMIQNVHLMNEVDILMLHDVNDQILIYIKLDNLKKDAKELFNKGEYLISKEKESKEE